MFLRVGTAPDLPLFFLVIVLLLAAIYGLNKLAQFLFRRITKKN